jgi:hypothetical protein
VHDLLAFGLRAGVAPQLGRRQHLACGVQRHETVLLARYADAGHPCAQRRIEPGEAGADRVDPPFRALLAATRVIGDQVDGLPLDGQHAAHGRIVGDQLDALRADIDANDKAHERGSASKKSGSATKS